jgi:cell division protein FtsI (penicillin-binding protein 3)
MRYALQQDGAPPAVTEPLDVELEYQPGDPAPGHPAGVTLDDIAIKDERTGG